MKGRQNMNNKFVEVKRKSKFPKILIAVIIALLFLGSNIFFFFLGNRLTLNGLVIPWGRGEISESLKGIDNVEKFKKLFSIRDELYLKYNGEIDEDKLVDGAIKGMTESLGDPYTVYMTKEEAESFNSKMQGNFSGVGIQLDIKDENIVVVTPIEGSPAEKAGILKGDVILKVDGKDVSSKEYDKALAMIRGEKGTDVTLTLYREDKGNFDIKLKRDTITVKSVEGEMLSNGVGYVTISSFDEHTDKEFLDTLNNLKGKGMKGIILDLRGNPGGYMHTAVSVASQFIQKDKVIVATKDKYNQEEHALSQGGSFIGTPLVVLIDNGTASASEIVSGAFKDYKVADLVGTKTFGKGVVQRPLELDDGTLLKVTISKWYTPNGNNIHKSGIEADYEVEYPKELATAKYNRSKDPQFAKALELITEKLK
ncbi:S41 family peptidase [Clostridium intestinale]|uniref:S41 family peptidase n=2 Tax=Clostridium intestinale TaxID=36845 RepID=A0A7D6VST9_9CLOT|nr:S41 family peptidase [Clostridium intestinale]